jgi:hypothetical protein
MTNFKTFTNAAIPFEGKKIAIDINKVSVIFEDILEDGAKVKLWSKENAWTVNEDFDTVMKIING